jgi:hypothetical protein
MTGPTITVIVPNYNDSRHLPRCLRSILDQQDGPQQLMVIDDKSTDDSVALIRSLINGDPRATLIENSVNLGVNKTVSEALARVGTDYALFLSANDFLLPGIFTNARRALARVPGVGLWSSMAWLVDEDDRPIRLHPSPVVALNDTYLSPQECARLAYRLGSWFACTTVIYHRDTLRAIGGFDPVYGAPADLFAALAVSGRQGAVFTPEPFATIRIHHGSYSSRAMSDIAGIGQILNELSARAPRLAPQMFTPAFLGRTVRRFYFACIRSTVGKSLPAVAARAGVTSRVALLAIHRLIPEKLAGARVALSFVVLRPFDLLPTLWYRLLGWTLVRIRLKLRGQAAPGNSP